MYILLNRFQIKKIMRCVLIIIGFVIGISCAAEVTEIHNDTVNMEDLRQNDDEKWESFAELFYGVMPIYIIVGVCLIGVCLVTLLRMNLHCGRTGHEHLTTIIQESGPSGGLVIDYPLILMDIGSSPARRAAETPGDQSTSASGSNPKSPDDPECPLLAPENHQPSSDIH